MAIRIVMPTFGMYTAEGSLARWLVEPGAQVEAGELVAEITTEKASYEIEAPAAGILHPVAGVGDPLAVEGLLGYILEAGEAVPDEASSQDSAALATGAPAEGNRPHGGAAAVTVEATWRGPERAREPEGGREPAESSEADTPASSRLRASPAARRLASQRGVDLANVVGSGPGGRIVEADVLAAAERAVATAGAAPSSAAAPTSSAVAPPAAAPAVVPWRIQRRIPLTGIRAAVARRLREAMASAVPLTLTREVRADLLVAARGRLRQRLDAPPSWDALFVKLFADALRQLPALNAIVAGDEVLVLDDVHVGFAVPVAEGLLVPVVRDADRRPLGEVAAAVRALGERARAGKAAPPDLLGGTATVSNLGAHGVDAFTPVLNPPQSAILGIGRIASRPVVEEGRIVAGHTCVLSLTFDHRVADGAPAAELLAAVAARMGDSAYLDSLAGEGTP